MVITGRFHWDSDRKVAIMSHNTPGKKTKTQLNKKDYWQTSDLAYRDACFLCGDSFDIDVAASKENSKCSDYISEQGRGTVFATIHPNDYLDGRDSLCDTQDWFLDMEDERAWCNPPFSKKIEFLQKAHNQRRHGLICVMIPYEPCTKWFREWVHNKATFVYVPDGRYNFIDPDSGVEVKGVNFASCFAVFTSNYFTETSYIHYERGISSEY